MKVMRRTFPRRSLNASDSQVSLVSVNAGAGPTTGRRAFTPTLCAHAAAVQDRNKATSHHARRDMAIVTSRLQFAFELVEEAPIRSLRDQLLGRALYHSRFAQAQRVETHRLL